MFLIWPAKITCALALAVASVGLAAEPAGKALATKSDCFACHKVDSKLVGPAYQDVAKKYLGDKTALAKLVKKVKEGGAGNWGQVPMAPHPQLSDEDLTKMVQWVLNSGKKGHVDTAAAKPAAHPAQAAQ